MQLYRNNKSLARVGALAAATFILAGCSSRPEVADIQKDLADVYACSIVELTDVKKIDGAEAGGKHYDVSFTYTMQIKGGKEAAAKLFAERSFLISQIRPAQDEYERIKDEVARRNSALYFKSGVATGAADDDPAVRAAAEPGQRMGRRLEALTPCKTPDVLIGLKAMYDTAEEAINSGQPQIPVPFAIKFSGVGRMSKAESGWHFIKMPSINMLEIVNSEPTTYPSFKPTAIQAPGPAVLEPSQKLLVAVDATPSNGGSASANGTRAAEPLPTQGPSFDCAKATTAVEKMICTDPKLAQADAATVALYKTAIEASATPDAIKQGQSYWRKNVRDVCPDSTCLSRVYQERLSELK